MPIIEHTAFTKNVSLSLITSHIITLSTYVGGEISGIFWHPNNKDEKHFLYNHNIIEEIKKKNKENSLSRIEHPAFTNTVSLYTSYVA